MQRFVQVKRLVFFEGARDTMVSVSYTHLIPNLDMPAVVSGPALTDAGAALQSAGGSMVYFPSMLEFGVVLGVFGLGALMLLLGLKFLPLKPTERSH